MHRNEEMDQKLYHRLPKVGNGCFRYEHDLYLFVSKVYDRHRVLNL